MNSLWEFVGTAKFLAGVAAAVVLLVMGWLISRRSPRYRPKTVSFSLPFGLGAVTYEISDAQRVAAWHLYVQLKTRKAAIPFDTQYDLVVEVLDSLFEVVAITRELLTRLPVGNSEGLAISDMMLRVLNDGLRPYLTKWQADFRRWWELAEQDPAHRDESPQLIQRAYPHYDELVRELMEMNQQLDGFANDLLAVVRSRRGAAPPPRRPGPSPPPGRMDKPS